MNSDGVVATLSTKSSKHETLQETPASCNPHVTVCMYGHTGIGDRGRGRPGQE